MPLIQDFLQGKNDIDKRLPTNHGMGRCLGMSGRLMMSASEMPLLLFWPCGAGAGTGSSWGSMGARAGSFWGWSERLRSVVMGGRSRAGLA